MLFFVSLRLRSESAPPETLTPALVKREVQRIHELLASGIVVNAWKRTEGIAIVLLLEVANEVACRAVLGALPSSQAGVLEIEMIVAVEPYLDVYPDPSRG
jgi:muconolactone delta-isomerase